MIGAFIISATTQYIGASWAVSLFDRLSPLGTAWVRAVGALVALWIFARPRTRPTRQVLRDAAVFGTVLVAMNLCFYEAISSLPLGTAVAIEFIGPILVGLVFARSARNYAAVALGGVAVAVLSGAELSGNPAGLAWIFSAAACWAAYIMLGKRMSAHGHGVSGLTVSLTAGALFWAPLGLVHAAPVWTDWPLLAAGLAVGVLSTAIPYGLDQLTLARLSPGQFAILLALLPATAAVVGAVLLAQIPSWTEVAGIAMVITAVAIRDTSSVSS